MKLNLKRPIVFFDLETTGTNVSRDRIVEISMIKVNPDGSEEVVSKRLNPEMPIPASSTAIHHITDEDVKDAPTFKAVASKLMQFFDDCDIAGFNSNKFDVPLLSEEFLRAGLKFDVMSRKFIDVQNIFHAMEPRTLIAAYRFYCGKDLEAAHSAEADTRATYEVLMSQLDKYETLKNDVDYLSSFSKTQNIDLAGRIARNENGEAVFNFGKYKGKTVESVLRKDVGYYSWMMQGDFPQNTKDVLTQLKFKIFGK
jgi:DNA polymerase-3 subunit epsilon